MLQEHNVFLAAVEEGVAAADRGEFVDDGEVRRWLEERDSPMKEQAFAVEPRRNLLRMLQRFDPGREVAAAESVLVDQKSKVRTRFVIEDLLVTRALISASNPAAAARARNPLVREGQLSFGAERLQVYSFLRILDVQRLCACLAHLRSAHVN
jgi:hypothetical protein